MCDDVERQLQEATQKILDSDSQKKLVVAGPGTGKTYLFRKLLEARASDPSNHLVLTFINNLKDDLERSLGGLSQVFTLHGFCQYLLHQHEQLREGLSADFKCYPGLVSLIKEDWLWLNNDEPPEFVKEMRELECPEVHQEFYMERAQYYDAVDFDDSVHRTYQALREHPESLTPYKFVLIDEFQDFNAMEAAVIDLLSEDSSIVIAGDDDQALYSQLRSASWDHIRAHYEGDEYEVFELPFCMRCPEVVVGAVNDIICRTRDGGMLEGRIDKPYRYYEPLKGEISQQYPTIDLVCTSVQRNNANYFGRYMEQVIGKIPAADIEEAAGNGEPTVLVIGPRQYLRPIRQHLEQAGLLGPEEERNRDERAEALAILRDNPNSNLGWRIILRCDGVPMAAEFIRQANEQGSQLVDILPHELREAVLQEVEQQEDVPEIEAEPADNNDGITVRLTSFEGSKGLSAQHVVLVGLHEGDLPRNSNDIKDIEICRFLVGLTRTKKKCSVLLTRNFAGNAKNRSPFIDWISVDRFTPIEVNAAYWKNQ